jgi:hypothetical protein
VDHSRHGLLALPAARRSPAAGFLVRLFMIQHDCGHGSFFYHRHANDWVGRVIGVLTLTPYDFWQRTHALHHASCGNLDNRGIGDVDTLTVHEFLALPRWRQLQYRLYRHPIMIFCVGLPAATSAKGSPAARCRRAAYAVPEPPVCVCVCGSLGRERRLVAFREMHTVRSVSGVG